MKETSSKHFFVALYNKNSHYPWVGQIELTYRCQLNCVHCYCAGTKSEGQELEAKSWKKILDEIQKEGCLNLVFTGGDPLVRDDFLDIYSYAKKKGFLVVIFTNGQGFNKEIIDYLAKYPPYSIEVTLNGIVKTTYETITQVPHSYFKAIENIKKLKEKDLKLILKSNCLKQNKDEIGKIKAFTEELLGKSSDNKYRFKYDPMIYPRLNGDDAPCRHRLSFDELHEVKKQDSDIWEEYQRGFHSEFLDSQRSGGFLYRCNSWMSQFFINPYGRLKFCVFSDKFSIDLKTTPFKDSFYSFPKKILAERFRTNSPCRDCKLRSICYYCPARSFLETTNEEGPVEYYCRLAQEMEKEMFRAKSDAKPK